MNVRCPQCETVFRVDPERIPVTGIKARCARCSTVFELSRQGAAPATRTAPPPAPVRAPSGAPALSVAAPAKEAAAPARISTAPKPEPPIARPVPPPVATPTPAAGATTSAAVPRPLPTRDIQPAPAPAPQRPVSAAAPEASAAPKRVSFRNQDPGARAQRLARALVSDIVAYNKDKLQQTSGAPALRSEFREEIRKSWEEYVEQVGLDLAKSTPYFRDALNEILARGEKVF
ncbi:MAG TPA: zinc-ribbon domain-containing protein [Longimicrobiales bacterium]|nr:zinc-ribbon domain-containing protein [Longimicrobiales bacterium]